MIRLVATDLDHTLLRGDRTVSDRTVAALRSARRAGITVVPVTARNVVGVRAVNARTGFDGWAVCGNGAYAVHLGTSDDRNAEPLFATEATPDALRRVVATVRAGFPRACFAAVRECGARFIAEDAYAALASATDHSRNPASMERATVDDLVDAPAVKLVFRDPDVPVDVLFDEVSELLAVRAEDTGVELTMSGAPFVELMAAGVSKATGLARLCSHLGVEPGEVLAVGDGLNDIPMLRWAGRGVAVANAGPDVRAAADEVTAAADDDGVAVLLEELNAQFSDSAAAPLRSS